MKKIRKTRESCDDKTTFWLREIPACRFAMSNRLACTANPVNKVPLAYTNDARFIQLRKGESKSSIEHTRLRRLTLSF